MLFTLAQKNIKGNLKNYFLYFASIVFDVTIYFVFQILAWNDQVKAFLNQDQRFSILFNVSDLIIAMFVAVFIGYSSTFFIKKRKKELGLYSLLGMKKKDIASLLFFENMLLGNFAIIVGIFIGGLLSKLFIMVLLKCIGISVYIKFSINVQAVIYTALIFEILFLISSTYSASIVYRFELIALFKADMITENKKYKNTKYYGIFMVLAMIFFIVEGLAVIHLKNGGPFAISAFTGFVAATIGNFVFFGGFLKFVVNRLKSNKKVYYTGDNLISISHFLYRIESNKKLLAIIALTNTVALGLISVTYSINNNANKVYAMAYPFSYCYMTTGKALDQQVETLINQSPQNQLTGSAEVELTKVSGKIENFKALNFDTVYLIAESEYERALHLRGLTYNFKVPTQTEAILLKYGPRSMDTIKEKQVTISDGNIKRNFKIIDRKLEEPLNAIKGVQVLLVQDGIYNQYANNDNRIVLKAYLVKNAIDSGSLSRAIIRIMPDNANLSYVQAMKSELILGGMMAFGGILIGLVFLTSTGSLLYFKQLTEATDDKARYLVLKKIGISKKEIKKSIAKQVIFLFLLPVVIAISHNVLVLILLNAMGVKIPIIFSSIVYILIYAFYYTITVKTYTKIVTES
ncbi:MAG: FtsX-like permease family protein [Cellulosilyticaceae bacterium]